MAFNQKNPPWQRNTGQNMPGMQTIVSFNQSQAVFNPNIGLQQEQNLSMIPQVGLQQQQLYSQAVQYTSTRPMNQIAFPNQTSQQSQNSKFNPSQRVFSGTGHVTKTQNDFGFIDEEVFFHKNVCKGSFPKVGDRVLVEAAYNQNMPFKWNATRVQILHSISSNDTTSGRQTSAYSTQSLSHERSIRTRSSPSRKSPERHGNRFHTDIQRDADNDEHHRRREDRDIDRHRDKYRNRTPDRERKERERSPLKRVSPKRKKIRPIPRYMVQIPKHLITLTNLEIMELRRRYHAMYIPSDFFTSEIRWTKVFPPQNPFSFRKTCLFHVMHKEVDQIPCNDVVLDPPDADYLYSAKVMLLSTPPRAEFYQKCFALAEDRDKYEDERDFVHPTRLINFLVGIRGKNETMAIGGPWSPSLDGENPDTDPNVLIKTAIRNCMALTGIDLSNCTRWYRFVELYYRRSETYHKGRLIPARVETVIVYLPDIYSCQPSLDQWADVRLRYKTHVDRLIEDKQQGDLEIEESTGNAPSSAEVSEKVEQQESSSNLSAAEKKEDVKEENKSSTTVDGLAEDDELNNSKNNDQAPEAKENKTAAIDEKNKGTLTATINVEKCSETERQLDIDEVKKMKVAELKAELQSRNLPTDGVKSVLLERLCEALEQSTNLETSNNTREGNSNDDVPADDSDNDSDVQIVADSRDMEKDEEEFETMDNVDMSEVTVIDEYDSTKSEEKSSDGPSTVATKKPEAVKLSPKEIKLLQKRYALPEQPHIIVHPSRVAKSGKFDCAVMSLSVLLDYRTEDSKEHSFEVSLFAELFNEMLVRDFGFNIYKALCLLPVKKDEECKQSAKNGDSSKEKSSKDDKKVSQNSDSNKTTQPAAEDELKDEKDAKEKAAETRERESRKKSRFDEVSSTPATDEDHRTKREREREKDRVVHYTADRELLLSFIYFDVSQCGYIFDKDIEDLFHTLGLNLSRSQIRRIVSKAVTRDSLYYRKLTDKIKTSENQSIVLEETTSSGSTNEGEKHDVAEQSHEWENLVTGNSNYKEQLKYHLDKLRHLNDETSKNDAPHPAKKFKVSESTTIDEGLVDYNGTVLDISKLLDQIKRVENARDDAEQLVADLRKVNDELSHNQTRATEKLKEQTADIKNLSKKLSEAEHSLREVSKKSNEYYSILSTVYDRVGAVIQRSETKRSSSLTSKNGTSRDRTARKDAKSRDRDTADMDDGEIGKNKIASVEQEQDASKTNAGDDKHQPHSDDNKSLQKGSVDTEEIEHVANNQTDGV